jgi:D-tyrosyl-tRNA(Tyr) deacylase
VKALVQRVGSASVSVGEDTVASIGRGFLVLLGVGKGDGREEAEQLAGKVARLRVFADATGKMNRSLLDVRGEALVVSQFTLFADTSRGNRPGFEAAALPGEAEGLYRAFVDSLAALGVPVQTGVFGADMQVALVNDGPVTIMLEKTMGEGGR